MSYHGFFRSPPQGVSTEQASKSFDAFLRKAVGATGEKRKAALLDWENATHARISHPREEHLIPLMVAAGAAKDEKAILIYNDSARGLQFSAFQFGA